MSAGAPQPIITLNLPAIGAQVLDAAPIGPMILAASAEWVWLINGNTRRLHHAFTHDGGNPLELKVSPYGSHLMLRTETQIFLTAMPQSPGNGDLKYAVLHEARHLRFFGGTQRFITWNAVQAKVWDSQQQRCIAELPPAAAPLADALILNGELAVLARVDGEIAFYDIASRSLKQSLRPEPQDDARLQAIYAAEKGHVLCLYHRHAGDTTAWDACWLDVEGGQVVRRLRHLAWYAVSEAGRNALFATADGQIEVWWLSLGRRDRVLPVPPQAASRQVWLADFAPWALARDSTPPHWLTLWSQGMAPYRALACDVPERGFARLGSERLALVDGGDTIRIYDIATLLKAPPAPEPPFAEPQEPPMATVALPVVAETLAMAEDGPVMATIAATTTTTASTAPQAPRQRWEVGAVIEQLYEIKNIFTTGGMGMVFHVRHRGWEKDLAVKQPRPEFFGQAGQRESFLREVDAWIHLGLHPHIVTCFYVRSIDDLPSAFVEFVAGGSLAEAIQQGSLYQGGQAAALERMLDIAIQSAWGLHHAHQQGLVHQDMKPANLLLTPEGRALVTDFGLARFRQSLELEQTGANSAEPVATNLAEGSAFVAHTLSAATCFGGTPAYWSPEQAGQQRLTRQTDLWSWAVAVLEMFAGRIAWRPGQVADAALRSYLDTPRNADSPYPAMPAPVANLLRRCLQVDAAERPRDMEECVRVLQEVHATALGRPYARPRPMVAALDADGLNNLALSFRDLGRDEEAIFAWQRALRANPRHLPSIYNQALIDWRAGLATDEEVLGRLENALHGQLPDQQSAWCLGHIALERLDAGTASQEFLRFHPEPLNHELEQGLSLAQAYSSRSLKYYDQGRMVTQGISALAFGRDEHRLIEVYLDCSGLISDPLSGGFEHRFTWSGDLPLSIEVAPSGRHFLIQTASRVHLAHFPDESGTSHLADLAPSGSVWGCFAPQADLFACAGVDRRLRIIDLASQQRVAELPARNAPLRAVAFFDGGKLVAVAGDDTLIQFHDVTAGRLVRSIEASAGSAQQSREQRTIIGLYAIHNGRKLLCILSHARRADTPSFDLVWLDPANGQRLRTLEGQRWYAFDRNLNTLLIGAPDGTALLHDLLTDTHLRSFDCQIDSAPGLRRRPIQLLGDRATLLTQEIDEKSVFRLWNLQPSRCRHTCLAGGQAFAVGRNYLALASQSNRVVLCAVPRPEIQQALQAPFLVCRAATSVEIASGQRRFEQTLQEALKNREAGNKPEVLRLVKCARSIAGYEEHPELLALWREIDYYFLRTGLRHARQDKGLAGLSAGALAYALHPSQKLAVIGGADGIARVFDLTSGECQQQLAGHNGPIRSVAISTSSLVVTGGADATLRLWYLHDGKCISVRSGHTAPVTGLRFCPAAPADLVAFSAHEAICWRLNQDTPLRIIADPAHEIAASDCGYVGDQLLLAVAGAARQQAEYAIRLWNVNTGDLFGVLAGHGGPVHHLAFDPKAQYLYSSASDHTLCCWDVAARALVWSLPLGVEEFLLTQQERKFLLVRRTDGTLAVHQAKTGTELARLDQPCGKFHSLALADNDRRLGFIDDKSLCLWTLEWELHDPENEIKPAPEPVAETILASTPAADELADDHPPPLETCALPENPLAAVAAPSGPAAVGTFLWRSGQRVLEEFEVLRPLGAGGFGEVYLLRNLATGVQYAAKRTLPANPAASQMLVRELQHWMALPPHPHLVPCRFFRTLDEGIVIFADFVAGGSLVGWIADGRPVTTAQRLDLAIQMAWALAAAHRHGLVHQDVKPDNVLLTVNGEARVTDFGIAAVARDTAEVESGVTVFGASQPYQSPEQAEALSEAQQGVPRAERTRIDAKSDMWSWGVTVLELFLGRRTWAFGQVVDEVVQEIASRDPGLLPPPVLELLWSVLHPDPEARPHDMEFVATRMIAAYRVLTGTDYPRKPPAAGRQAKSAVFAQLFTPGARQREDVYWLENLLSAAGRNPDEAAALAGASAAVGKAGLAAEVAGFAAATRIADELWRGAQSQHWPLLAGFFSSKANLHQAADDLPGATIALGRLSGICRAALAATPDAPEWLARLANSHAAMADIQNRRGRQAEALAAFERAIQLLQPLAQAGNVAGYRSLLGITLLDRANALALLGRLSDACTDFERGFAWLEPALAADWSETLALNLASGYNNRGSAHYEARQFEAALAWYDKGIALRAEIRQKSLSSKEPELADGRGWLNRANTLGYLGYGDEAVAEYQRSIALFQKLAESGVVPEAARELARAWLNVSLCHARSERRLVALECAENAARAYQQLVEQDGRSELRAEYAQACGNAAIRAQSVNKLPLAIDYHQRALANEERLMEQEGRNDLRAGHGERLYQLAALLALPGGDPLRAIALFQKGLPILLEQAGDPAKTRTLLQRLQQFGRLCLASGNLPAGIEIYGAVEKLATDDEKIAEARLMKGQFLQGLKRLEEARAGFKALVAWIDGDLRRRENDNLHHYRYEAEQRLAGMS